MLGKTTILAIRVLTHLGGCEEGYCVTPKRLAEILGESPTYLAKVCRLLVKAGILRARKGAKGGVWLSRPAPEVTLLSVVEACQGSINGDYCAGGLMPDDVCNFHRAAVELQDAITGVLARWNLAALLEKRHPAEGHEKELVCVLMSRGGA